MSIYPSIPTHATKDWFEMFEPLEEWELECTCKWINGEMQICQSCKVYFDLERDLNNV